MLVDTVPTSDSVSVELERTKRSDPHSNPSRLLYALAESAQRHRGDPRLTLTIAGRGATLRRCAGRSG